MSAHKPPTGDSAFIKPHGVYLIGCQYALDRQPAIYEAARAAWWIDKGAGAMALQGAPIALLAAAQAYSQGRARGEFDRYQEEIANK